jgi:hypothetical protein
LKAKYLLPLAVLLISSWSALAQSEDEEPAAIIEIGGAGARNLKDPGTSGGPDFAVEFTPIENWLEIEIGTTPLFSHHPVEWDTDLLVKKPWTLSKKVEFMAGVGPAWSHSSENGISSNTVSIEVVLDVMFWPSEKHRFGWFIEPAYEQNFGSTHERSIGLSTGLLIGLPRSRKSRN